MEAAIAKSKEPSAEIRTDRNVAIWLFSILFLVYQFNVGFLPGDDAAANIFLPMTIIKNHRLSFAPETHPFMFSWRKNGVQNADTTIYSTVGWRSEVKNWPESIGYRLSEFQLIEERYFIVRSARENSYVNTFGIGTGLFALPVFALLHLAVGLESQSTHFFWYVGKVVASSAVAGSAVLIFLIAARFCARGAGLLLAFAYGLGTCVWSISSQSLWQHGPVELFLALGAYFYLKPKLAWKDWVFVGFAWALASLCRPTIVTVVLVMGSWLAVTNRGSFVPFCLGAAPIGGLMAIYNWYYFDNPVSFGQTERGVSIALEKTGSTDVWQTPLLDGLAGLLVSPSRGLFIYSPFLILAVFGMCRIWKEPSLSRFRPLTLSVVALVVIASKWFDWWGGWAYGYRPIVDAAPLLVLFMISVLPWALNGFLRRTIFGSLLIWSIAVQFIGAFSYDLSSWNNRGGMNIDRPAFRYRLWSLQDNQIWYYCIYFCESSEKKFQRISN